jgi:hypothetical protein
MSFRRQRWLALPLLLVAAIAVRYAVAPAGEGAPLKPLWTTPLVDVGELFLSSNGRMLYAIQPSSPGWEEWINTLDAKSGKVLGRERLPFCEGELDGFQHLFFIGDDLYCGASYSETHLGLASLDDHGKTQWRSELALADLQELQTGRDAVAAFRAMYQNLWVGYDDAGAVVWVRDLDRIGRERGLSEYPVTMPDGSFVIADDKGLLCLGRDGSDRWSLEDVRIESAGLWAGGSLLCTGRDEELELFFNVSAEGLLLAQAAVEDCYGISVGESWIACDLSPGRVDEPETDVVLALSRDLGTQYRAEVHADVAGVHMLDDGRIAGLIDLDARGPQPYTGEGGMSAEQWEKVIENQRTYLVITRPPDMQVTRRFIPDAKLLYEPGVDDYEFGEGVLYGGWTGKGISAYEF